MSIEIFVRYSARTEDVSLGGTRAEQREPTKKCAMGMENQR